MKDEQSQIVRYKRKPLTAEQIERLRKVADLPDDQIDFTEMPELPDSFFENAVQGAFYRPLKRQTTLRLDANVIEWFKRQAKDGRGYQTDINRVLREHVAAQSRKATKKSG